MDEEYPVVHEYAYKNIRITNVTYLYNIYLERLLLYDQEDFSARSENQRGNHHLKGVVATFP